MAPVAVPMELRGRMQPPMSRALAFSSSAALALLGVLGIFVALAGRPEGRIPAEAWGAFVRAMALLSCVLWLLPPRRMMRIDNHGLTWCNPLWAYTLPWTEIVEMHLITVPLPLGAMDRVLIVPKSADSFIANRPSPLTRITIPSLIRRFGGVLTPPTEMPAPQLLRILQDSCRGYSSASVRGLHSS